MSVNDGLGTSDRRVVDAVRAGDDTRVGSLLQEFSGVADLTSLFALLGALAHSVAAGPQDTAGMERRVAERRPAADPVEPRRVCQPDGMFGALRRAPRAQVADPVGRSRRALGGGRHPTAPPRATAPVVHQRRKPGHRGNPGR